MSRTSEDIDLREVLLYTIASHKPTLDLVKRLLGILGNEIEIDDSDVFFHHLVSACIEAEERRLDILSYISTSIREIDVQSSFPFKKTTTTKKLLSSSEECFEDINFTRDII